MSVLNTRVVETLSTTCHAMSGGVDAVYGVGQDYLLTFGTAYNAFDFNVGDKITMLCTDTATHYQTQIGAGYVTGQQLTHCVTFQNKIYGLSGGSIYCSALYEPTVWNDPNASGNGYVTLSNWHGKSEKLTAMSTYQGRMAFFSRDTTQIWQIDADMNNWSLVQVLPNFGAVATLSVQNSGELDVIFLSSTGIRSLRARTAALNAFVADIGSPIDTLVQAAIAQGPNPSMNPIVENSCSIIEPTSGRYWCFIPPAPVKNLVFDGVGSGIVYPSNRQYIVHLSANTHYYVEMGANEFQVAPVGNAATGFSKNIYAVTGDVTIYGKTGMQGHPVTTKIYEIPQRSTLYVLSQYPSNQILAWSTYQLTDDSGYQQSGAVFFPQKFVTFKGVVYCRDENGIYAYGKGFQNMGFTDGQTGYDYTSAKLSTPWLDLDTPGTRKQAKGIDTAFIGSWTFSVGMDQLNEQLDYVWKGNQPTFQLGSIEYSNEGTHFRMQAVSDRIQIPMSIGSLIFHYQMAGEK